MTLETMRKAVLVPLLMAAAAAVAQDRMNGILDRMPEGIILGIDREQQSELAMSRGAGDTIRIRNLLGGTTEIDSISDDFVRITSGKFIETQVRVLDRAGTQGLICVVRTIGKPVAESTVRFFDMDWSPAGETFSLPDTDSPEALLGLFVERPDTMTLERFDELVRYIEPVMVSADFSREGRMTLRMGIPLTAGDVAGELRAIIRRLEYTWDGEAFRPS